VLHVTNGDSAAERLLAAGFTGPILAWRDVLHEGPVPDAVTPEELAAIRGRFVVECGWPGDAAESFVERDRTLVTADSATLWFEPDLYDQLQLLQVLAMLKGKQIPTWMVPTTDYLGCAETSRLRELWELQQPVSEAQFELGERGWAAFRSEYPTVLPEFAALEMPELPQLGPALARLLEDRPADKDGLARSERQILRAVEAGATTFGEVFAATRDMEPAQFMGDSVLRIWIGRLEKARTPLVTGEPYRLTGTGRRVLDGSTNFAELNGVDRWMGGLHLEVLDEAARLARMRADWDGRARENARYYVATSNSDWTEEEFYRYGEQTVAEEILTDMTNICQGRDPKQMRVLEIGCGAGRITRALAKVFGEVHAVDVSGEMVERARAALQGIPNAFVYQNSGKDLAILPDIVFDFAFSTIVFQHIPYREIIYSYVREVHRLLRPGGLFKFQVQGGGGLKAKPNDTWVGVSFSDEQAVEMARDCGFEPRYRHGAGEQYFYLWFFKL
jgi:SAM-dependent methyltransferase